MTRQTISRWEQDKTMPNIHVLQELSVLYGLSIDDLVAKPELGTVKKEENLPDNSLNLFVVMGVVFFYLFLFSGGGHHRHGFNGIPLGYCGLLRFISGYTFRGKSVGDTRF